VLAREPALAAVAISATTRPQRPGEADGREYYFLSDAEFQRGVDADQFEEHVSFAGGRYGTLKAEVDRLLGEGKNVVLELEVEGSFAIHRRRPEAVLIFIDAPLSELERRLTVRATEMAGEIEMRLRIAREQRAHRDEFDHVIVNNDVERATDELYATMRAEVAACADRGARHPEP
jgi:guanylate kinase